MQNGPRTTALFSIEFPLLLQSQLSILYQKEREKTLKKQRGTSTSFLVLQRSEEQDVQWRTVDKPVTIADAIDGWWQSF